MDDFSISSSSSPNSSAHTIQQRLQFILHNLPQWFAYSIFWLASKDSAGNLIFSWSDGHFRGTRNGGGSQLISFGFDDVAVDRVEAGDFSDLEGYGLNYH